MTGTVQFSEQLDAIQQEKKSALCVGLDPVLEMIPPHLRTAPDWLSAFSLPIIEATAAQAVAFKFNFAFFEACGPQGMETLHRLRRQVPAGCLAIADAKRGDIGSSARQYAHAIFDLYGFDAVTVNPYMGHDASIPFLAYQQKGIFFLCLTSNTGAQDVQLVSVGGRPLYEHVAALVESWNTHGNCGLVAGATRPEALRELRARHPALPLLVPGIGSQGGQVDDVLAATGGRRVLLSASRSIIYASTGRDFQSAARREAERLHRDMQKYFE